MARPSRILARVRGGTADRAIRFADLRRLLLALGFDERIRGSHHIYTRTGIVEILNLQPRDGGLAKAYRCGRFGT